PFVVFATQNPIEHEGTYRLPEAQLDRFLFKIDVLYPEFEQELCILKEHHGHKATNKEELVHAVVSADEIVHFQHLAKLVFVHEDILKYIAEVVIQTRTNANLTLGASPRASIAILEASNIAIDARGEAPNVRFAFVRVCMTTSAMYFKISSCTKTNLAKC